MTSYQTILAEAKRLAKDSSASLERKIELLESLRDEIQSLIDEIREGGEQK